MTPHDMGKGSPEDATSAAEHWVWLARIRRTQGRKGEVFADILTDFPEKFAERKRLWLLSDKDPQHSQAPREVQLIADWLHKGGVVLHFAGIDSISSAETLIGLGVAIPKSERTRLGPDEAYIPDLIGCTVIDVAGGVDLIVGEIYDVDTAAGPAPLLVIHNKETEILVPFAKSYLRKLDIEGRRIEMALPEGLIDLNS